MKYKQTCKCKTPQYAKNLKKIHVREVEARRKAKEELVYRANSLLQCLIS